MPYDYSRLIGRIIGKFRTQARFAEALGLSERSVSLKLNGKVPWKQPEISKACQVLDIKSVDIPSYFFVVEVQD